jgi:hypothetical protein
VKVKLIISGLATYVPGLSHLTTKGTGGTDSARYCYSVWLRHLVMAHLNGLSTKPKVVAELGPGDSIGVGLAALITGAEKYYALDVVEYANTQKNLEIFDELVTLFKNREAIPNEAEFPLLKPYLTSYEFPNYILDDNHLNSMINDDRIDRIKKSIINMDKDNSFITYRVPWFEADVIEAESVDMISSQAVLQYVDDLRTTYEALYSWLKPGGFMSHQISFTCHGTADEWNGHWKYSDFVWNLVRGRYPYLNREPCSTHINLINEAGFRIVYEKKVKTSLRFGARDLATRFRNISEDDLTTSGIFIQAEKVLN